MSGNDYFGCHQGGGRVVCALYVISCRFVRALGQERGLDCQDGQGGPRLGSLATVVFQWQGHAI